MVLNFIIFTFSLFCFFRSIHNRKSCVSCDNYRFYRHGQHCRKQKWSWHNVVRFSNPGDTNHSPIFDSWEWFRWVNSAAFNWYGYTKHKDNKSLLRNRSNKSFLFAKYKKWSRLAKHNIPPYDKLFTKVSTTNYYQDFKLNGKEFY